MEVEMYISIVSFIRNYRGLSFDCIKKLKEQFPEIREDTLFSIVSLEYQKRMKITHSKTNSNKNKYWDLYKAALKRKEKPGIIVRMAEAFNVGPCLVAKIILRNFFENTVKKDGQEHDEKLSNVNIYLRDTKLIEDMDLSYEVFLCTLFDNMYSPLSELMRSSTGQQFEIKLYNEATKFGLSFRDEEYLRKRGYDKTPDCKADVPLLIDGFIVNWIESKALFADKEAHREYTKNQYSSYWNRFGTGLIIYWFGYVKTIVDPNEKRFIIRDHLPQNIVQIPPPDFDMDD